MKVLNYSTVFTFSMLTALTLLFQAPTVAAHHPIVLQEGLVPNCEAIGGNVESYAFNRDHSQEFDLCDYEGGIYRIATGVQCPPVDAGRSSEDPVTGKVYFFSWICDEPVACNPDYFWSDNATSQYQYDREIRVITDNKTFDVITTTKGSICTYEIFNKDNKGIEIYAKGMAGDNSTTSVIIPKELLRGNFTLLIDSEYAPFSTKQTDDSTTIIFDLTLDTDRYKRVEIVGTQVIPEFGSTTILLVAALLVTVVGLTFHRRIFRSP